MISIDNRDPRPLYEQAVDGFRTLIVAEALAPDDKLPSVRSLAMQLAINPNTIQRAYRELETEGIIYTVPGKGCFAGKPQEVDKGRMQQLLTDFDRVVGKLLLMGITKEELQMRIAQEGVAEA